MVESTGLENRHTLIAYLGFKSLSLRHYIESPLRNQRAFVISDVWELDGICIKSQVSRDLGLVVLELSHYKESLLRKQRAFVVSDSWEVALRRLNQPPNRTRSKLSAFTLRLLRSLVLRVPWGFLPSSPRRVIETVLQRKWLSFLLAIPISIASAKERFYSQQHSMRISASEPPLMMNMTLL